MEFNLSLVSDINSFIQLINIHHLSYVLFGGF